MPPYASNLSYTTLGQTYPMLPYAGPALRWICPTPVTYPTPPYANNLPTLTTYPTPSSLSVCELPLAATPSAPSPNLQVHERFLFRMVPHKDVTTLCIPLCVFSFFHFSFIPLATHTLLYKPVVNSWSPQSVITETEVSHFYSYSKILLLTVPSIFHHYLGTASILVHYNQDWVSSITI